MTMDDSIMKQIQILQEMKSKCIEVCGFYGDTDTALAALQICSTFGLDNTARLVSILNRNGITTHEQLNEIIQDASLNKSKLVYIKNDKMLCPNCSNELIDNVKHCENCGQSVNYDNVGVIESVIIEPNSEESEPFQN